VQFGPLCGGQLVVNHENFNFYLGELVPTDEGLYLVAQLGYEDLFTEGLDAAVTYHFINEDAWAHIMADMEAGDLTSRWAFENLESPTDYRAIEGFGKFSTELGGTPVSVQANYLQNLEDTIPGASEWTQAAWVQITVMGKPSDPGDWQLTGEWGKVQANSVLSWLTDADRGSGDHEWIGGTWQYRLLKNTDFVVTYLSTDRLSRDNAGFDLLHVDVIAKI